MSDVVAHSNTQTEYMLTTVDNPWDPFTHFNEWMAWDSQAGYNTPGLLARLVHTADELSEADHAQAIRWAIDEVMEFNVSGMWKVVSRETSKADRA